MHAIVFDIDGTLIESNKLDDETYLSVIHDILGPVQLRPSWRQYKNISGSGTLLEILSDNNITAADSLLRAAEEAFAARIANHIAAHGPIMEIPGAREFVGKLSRATDCKIAYATAGWKASARLKLTSSQFPTEGIPLATCNDHVDKVSIMAHALNQLAMPFESITYYGDGEQDRLAANALGWDFIAVGEKLNGLRQFC